MDRPLPRVIVHAVNDDAGYCYSDAFVALRGYLQSEEALSDRRTVGFMRILDHARWCRRWCPVPGRQAESGVTAALEALAEAGPWLGQAYPETARLLDDLRTAADMLLEEQSPGLAEAVYRLLDEHPESVLALPHAMNRRALSPVLRKRLVPRYQVVDASFEGPLVLLGPMWMWVAAQFSAPLTAVTHVMRPSWVRDLMPIWHRLPELDGVVVRGAGPVVAVRRERRTDEFMDDAPPTPRTGADFHDMVKGFIRTRRLGDVSEDRVQAHAFVLAGNRVAFLRRAKTVDVLDLSERTVRLRSIDVKDVEPDHFIVLRTEGAEDLLRQEADLYLGDRAEMLRKNEQLWKSIVLDLVQREGIDRACATLMERGGRVATRDNVMRWACGDTIYPRYDEDLRAILSVIDFADVTPAMRKNLEALDKAHQEAGRRLKQKLNAAIEALPSSAMWGLSERRFGIEGGGERTAFLVERCLPQMVEVGYRDLDQALEGLEIPD